MIGTLTYFLIARAPARPVSVALLFVLGLAGIAYSLATLTANSSFPGFNAVPACLGTALIILSGERSQWIGNRILGFGPINYIGRISYTQISSVHRHCAVAPENRRLFGADLR
jgi:peptidoglycan/LPS O-acetylase OafA/YrhL